MNKKSFYTVFGLVFGLLFAANIALMFVAQAGKVVHPHLFFAHLFMAGLTVGGFEFGAYGLKTKPDQFYMYYLGTMTARMFLVFAFLATYLFGVSKEGKFAMVGGVFFFYIVYTAIEIFFLIKGLKAIDFKSLAKKEAES